jgi:hypothetical protein
MNKLVSVTNFVTSITRELYAYRHYRVRFVGADSDGYFVIHLVDKNDNQKFVRINCWENT